MRMSYSKRNRFTAYSTYMFFHIRFNILIIIVFYEFFSLIFLKGHSMFIMPMEFYLFRHKILTTNMTFDCCLCFVFLHRY